MKVSLNWLKEYVDIEGLSAQEIADALTNSGLEVDGIETVGGQFSKVVVAKCTGLEPHPNADKLRLASVDAGPAGKNKVVCGAKNLEEGMLIAFALDGAQVINRKDGSLFTLGKVKIRGVESSGMICSIGELGLQEQYTPNAEGGIWPIKDYVDEKQLGQDLKEALNLQGDTVLETVPTANRGDLMSMVGVAREVAALFDRKLTLPDVTPLQADTGKASIKIDLPHPEVCNYYGGVVLENLNIGPSPDWVVARLSAAGARAINNVVDVTNYVMLELGQPLHAFDHDKLGKGGVVSVRPAKDKEELVTLDEEKLTLTPQAMVVTKDDRAVAMAGVMGGLETAIDDKSKHLFLEGAFFDPAHNRKSGKSVGLRTESSARFERGVDCGGTQKALARASQLLSDWAGASVVQFVESPVPKIKTEPIALRLDRIEKIIGVAVSEKTVTTILTKLGLGVEKKDKNTVTVTVPSYRQIDVYREIDLIEEVIRIDGYDKVSYTLPKKTASVPFSLRASLIDQTHQSLSGFGLQEVVTTSLIGDALLKKTGFTLDQKQLVTVTNSHSVDHVKMRQSLLPNLIEVAKYNQSQGIEDVWVYELGRCYFKKGKAANRSSGVAEQLYVSGLITGATMEGAWQQSAQTDFYTAKGIVEGVFKNLLPGQPLLFKAESNLPYLHPGKSAQILLDEKRQVGVLGCLHPLQAERLKFRQPVFVFELCLEPVFKVLKQMAGKQDLSKPLSISPYPAVKRDIAFSAPVTLSHQEIVNTLRAGNEPLLRGVELFDQYTGEQLGEGQRSLAYRLVFQSDEATLTDAQIEAAVTKLRDQLKNKLPVEFR